MRVRVVCEGEGGGSSRDGSCFILLFLASNFGAAKCVSPYEATEPG